MPTYTDIMTTPLWRKALDQLQKDKQHLESRLTKYLTEANARIDKLQIDKLRNRLQKWQ